MTLKERIFVVTLFATTILMILSFVIWPTILGGISALILSMASFIVLLEYGKIK